MWALAAKFLPFINPVEIIGKLFGNKEKRQSEESQERAAGYNQFAAEFKEPRNWFDSLINGLNRIPRPLGFFLTVWMFIWPLYDLETFVSAMNAYTLFPEWLGVLIGSVWAFYYVSRTLAKDMKFGQGISKKQLESYLKANKELSGLASPSTDETDAQHRMSDSQFRNEMKSSKPLSLPAIEEWNHRRQNS